MIKFQRFLGLVICSLAFGALALPHLFANSSDTNGHAQQPAKAWTAKMISSGHNFPTVDINRDGLIDLAGELHERISLKTIRDRHSWSDADLSSRIERLRNAGLVKESPKGYFLPTFMVISTDDAARHLPVSQDLVRKACDLIVRHLSLIREEAKQIPGLQERSYDSYSFLVLSDALLDNWQIQEVEKSLLGNERPLRDGNRYYFAVMEVAPHQTKEAFGLYGNGGSVQSGKEIDVYGNDRYSGHTLVSASDANLRDWFLSLPSPDDRAFWPAMVGRITAINPDRPEVPADLRTGMEKLHLIDRGGFNFLVLPRDSTNRLYDLAKIIAPDLVALLRAQEPALQAAYAASPYEDETTFNEYFIWWYHFFYTRVTNQLAADGLLRIPMSGNVTYFVVDGDAQKTVSH